MHIIISLSQPKVKTKRATSVKELSFACLPVDMIFFIRARMTSLIRSLRNLVDTLSCVLADTLFHRTLENDVRSIHLYACSILVDTLFYETLEINARSIHLYVCSILADTLFHKTLEIDARSIHLYVCSILVDTLFHKTLEIDARSIQIHANCLIPDTFKAL